jgi:hypothetical protein
VVLGQDQPLPSIEEELVPQGQAENAAARNANIRPFDRRSGGSADCTRQLGRTRRLQN